MRTGFRSTSGNFNLLLGLTTNRPLSMSSLASKELSILSPAIFISKFFWECLGLLEPQLEVSYHHESVYSASLWIHIEICSPECPHLCFPTSIGCNAFLLLSQDVSPTKLHEYSIANLWGIMGSGADGPSWSIVFSFWQYAASIIHTLIISDLYVS